MARQVDNDVLVGFVDEVRQYLPEIMEGIESFWNDSEQIEGFETAYRHIHTIKGASSMVGLAALSHIANSYEECLEQLRSGDLPRTPEAFDFLKNTPLMIELYLNHALEGALTDQFEESIVSSVNEACQGIFGQSDPIQLIPTESADSENLLEEDLFNEDPFEDDPFELFEVDDIEAAIEESQPIAEAPIENNFEQLDAIDLSGDLDLGIEEVATATADEIDVDPEPEEPSLSELIALELIEPFTIEAEEHLYHISLCLNELSNTPGEMNLLDEIRRRVHTLKGAAGTVGFSDMSSLSHRMEDLLDYLFERKSPMDKSEIGLLFSTADALEDLLNKRASSDILPHLFKQYDLLFESLQSTDATAVETVLDLSNIQIQPDPADRPETESVSALESQISKEPVQMPTTPLTAQEVVRVPLNQLDDLVRSVSELVITRASLEQYMGGMARISTELLHSFERLRRVASEIEAQNKVLNYSNNPQVTFSDSTSQPLPGDMPVNLERDTKSFDPYQNEFDDLQMDRYSKMQLLNRDLTETTHDIRTIHDELRLLSGDFDATLNRQKRLSGEIQDRLMRTRMVPLANLATQLHRVVRVVSQTKEKQVRLILEGEHTELDKEVLEEITNPLFHILRNAVDHGLETPAQRLALGKPEQGEIRLHTYHGGNQVVIEIEDDGAGIDKEKLLRKAIGMNLISEDEVGKLSEQDIYSLVFVPGFSTALELSEVSGRGVGLDVVKTSINKLKGSISIESTMGQGTKFTIRLPLTLAIIQSLMIRSNEDTYAIPLAAINQILRIDQDQIELIGEEQVLQLNGQVYPILFVDEVLNSRPPAFAPQAKLPVLIIDTGFQKVALIVDDIIEGREIVVKTLGNHLRKVHGITGATLLGDGRVVLILNPAELGHEATQPFSRFEMPSLAHASVNKTLEVLIVDDSVSVRRVLSNLVKNSGWQAITAKDGLEALEILQRANQLPDVILMDIEMPRMDGYELTKVLQAHELFSQIPIIMLTSRASDIHRQKAFTLGVDEYMVKPFQDETLLNTVRKLTQKDPEHQPVLTD